MCSLCSELVKPLTTHANPSQTAEISGCLRKRGPSNYHIQHDAAHRPFRLVEEHGRKDRDRPERNVEPKELLSFRNGESSFGRIGT